MAFSISTTQTDDAIICKLEGRLDVKAAREAEEALTAIAQTPQNVILDMTDLEYIASAGLRTIKRLYKTTGDSGYSVTVTNVSEYVMEILEITGFAAMLKFA